MKHLLSLILIFSAAQARADYGPRFVVDQAVPARLDQAAQKISYRFSCPRGGLLSAASVYCSEAKDPPLARLGLYADLHGKPTGAALRVGEFVPKAGSWSTLAMDGTPLKAGAVYHLVLQWDRIRSSGGEEEDLSHGRKGHSHVVEKDSSGRFASFAATLPFHGLRPSGEKDPASQVMAYDGQSWTELGRQGVFVLRLGDDRMEGNPYAQGLNLPVYAGQQQAQVLHFSCELVPSALELRLRKRGSPAQALQVRILENQYEVQKLVEQSRSEIKASEVGTQWKWVRVPLSGGLSLKTECYYVALSTGAAEADGYELSGMRAPEGLQGAAEAGFDGGAHRSRASSSGDGQAWKDSFETDGNVVLKGADCPVWEQGESSRPMTVPPPPFSNVWWAQP